MAGETTEAAALLALGSAALFARMLPITLATLAAGTAFILLWPHS